MVMKACRVKLAMYDICDRRLTKWKYKKTENLLIIEETVGGKPGSWLKFGRQNIPVEYCLYQLYLQNAPGGTIVFWVDS